MEHSVTNILPGQELERDLREQSDPLKRIILLDKLAGLYTFSRVRQAKSYLSELDTLLQAANYPDFRISYHLRMGLVENQLYNFVASQRHFVQGIQLLEEMGSAKELAEAYIDYAGTCMNLEQLTHASDLLYKAERLLDKFPDDRLAARMLVREGFLNLKFEDYPTAIEKLIQADEATANQEDRLSEKDYYFLTLTHSGLGKLFELSSNFERSVAAYLKVVDMCEELGIRTRMSWHYLNLGVAYLNLIETEQAELCFQRAIEVEDDDSRESRGHAYTNLGSCAYDREAFTEALELLDKAEASFQENMEEDHRNLALVEAWRGRSYAAQADNQTALTHFGLAYRLALVAEDVGQQALVCREIASINAEQKDYKNAFEWQVLADKYNEDYFNRLQEDKRQELEVRLEAARRHRESELMRLEATRLQLKALRAQMNPHFMFNALNAIQHHIQAKETDKAADYLARFAQLMRTSLEHSEMEIISLEDEIEFLRDYLFLNEQLRFEDRLTYEIKVDDEIEEDILGVPTMIIQPYVENAIEHGLRSVPKGKITISFNNIDDHTLECVVEDNGIGREQAGRFQQQDPKRQNHRSRGTRITEQRLEILHGQTSGQTGDFVAIFDLKDSDTGQALGTRVVIQIPIVDIQMR